MLFIQLGSLIVAAATISTVFSAPIYTGSSGSVNKKSGVPALNGKFLIKTSQT